MKRVWNTIRWSLGVGIEHHYTGNTLTGAEYKVFVGLRIEDGPETGRYLQRKMTPEQAREEAADLLAAADRADGLNREAGCRTEADR
jgi:hypothetical protein